MSRRRRRTYPGAWCPVLPVVGRHPYPATIEPSELGEELDAGARRVRPARDDDEGEKQDIEDERDVVEMMRGQER